jgi:site-specific recombinase XerD
MVKPIRRRSNRRRCSLTLPELEHSKAAVLNSLGSLQSRRSYRHAIEEFIRWYCSEPRLARNRAVVLRYRLHLENIPLAPSTINVRLAAIRRIAYEAADTGLLSPELVAGIRRVKGIKRLGQPVGNWLTAQQGCKLLATSQLETLRGKRDRAMLALLLGCGLRRSELVTLESDQVQKREDHWVIVDLVGKARHVRTVAHTALGQRGCRCLDFCCWHSRGKVVSVDSERWRCLGFRSNPKCCLVCRKEVCTARRDRHTRPTRFAPYLRTSVPQCRWRTGTDSVSPRAHLSADH